MLGAFKDIFGKKATDLHKKEFFDKKKEKSYTLQSKTADGVAFKGSMDAMGASELNLDFKDSDMEVKNKLNHEAKFTVDSTLFKVADGIDATMVFVTPTCTNDTASLFETVTIGAKYATADLNVNPQFEMGFKDGMTPDTFTFATTVAAKVMDNVNAGLSLDKFKFIGGKVSGDMDLAFSHICKECQIAAHVLGSVKETKPEVKSLSASFWQQATADTSIAAAFTVDMEKKVSVTLGTDYMLTPTSNIKTKLGYVADSAPSIDLAWVQKFDGKTLSLSHQVAEKAKIGLSLTIEA